MRYSDIAYDPAATKVVVVSDDPALRDSLATLLHANGFHVEIFSRAGFAMDSSHSALVLGPENREPRRGHERLRFPGAEVLTAREIDVLEQIATGASSEEAAQALGISRRTVESHRANILERLGARNTAALIGLVLGRGK